MWERRGHYVTITFPLILQDILNIPLLVPILLYLQQHFSCSENLKETWVIKIVRRWKTLAWKLEKLRKLDTSLYKSTTYFILYYCSRYKTCKVRIDLIMIPTRWERELQEKNVDIIRLEYIFLAPLKIMDKTLINNMHSYILFKLFIGKISTLITYLG